MSTDEVVPDALLSLRKAIAANTFPIATISADASSAADTETNLALASHLQFNHDGHYTLPLDTPTRFEFNDAPLNLRSVYFAWLSKDVAINDYFSETQRLSEQLSATGKGVVQNLLFAQRTDLYTWLEGASDESEYIKPLEADAAATAAQASDAADVAAGTAGGVATVPSGVATSKTVNPRLQMIYNGERKIGDRNSILRGIKPTDFSHIRKYAETFLGRGRNKPGRPAAPVPSIPTNPALATGRTKPGRRPEPIILLSPSASSLLRMSNIKSFLDNGLYSPPDSTSSSINILHISRLLPSIDPQRPLRFILVDSPDQFKPDYWSRVAAVFTTGQTWQFKSYKWQSPPELFSRALGIYVGWRGEEIPSTVRGWGRGVVSTQIDKHNAHQGAQARWRDREVVEGIWTVIEESMRSKGWNRDGIGAGK